MNLKPLKTILFAAILVEVLLFTAFRGVLGYHISPLVFFLASVIIGGVLIMIGLKGAYQPLSDKVLITKGRSIAWLVFIGGLILSGSLLNNVFNKFPVDITQTDVIAQLQTLVQRTLRGDFPYQIISDWGWDMFPTYLPMQWLPFIIPEYLGFDYRLMAALVFLMAIAIYGIRALKLQISLWQFVLILLMPILVFLCMFTFKGMLFRGSIETMIVGYYLLIGLSLFSNSDLIKALALTCCLFSRYSIVLWVPLFFLITTVAESRRNALMIAGYVLVGFVAVYGIPFLLKDPSIFLKGYQYHSFAALGEWHHNSPEVGNRPVHLFNAVGFACYFYDFVEGTVAHRLKALQVTHLVLSLLTVGGLAIWYYKVRHGIQHKVFLLGSLKIYLAVFYSFIQIPYLSLFMVPVFLSVPVAMVAMQYQAKQEAEGIG